MCLCRHTKTNETKERFSVLEARDRGKTKGPLVIDTSRESPANLAHNPFPQAKVFSLCVEYVLEHAGH